MGLLPHSPAISIAFKPIKQVCICFIVSYTIKLRGSIANDFKPNSTGPAAPTGVVALDIDSNVVQLTWDTPSPPNGVIAYYTVSISSTVTGTYYRGTGSNATAFNVTALTPCNYYSFAVAGINQCNGCTGTYSTLTESSSANTQASSVLNLCLAFCR